MSEADLDSGDVTENPAPEEDSDLVSEGAAGGCLPTDQPEDDFCNQQEQQPGPECGEQISVPGDRTESGGGSCVGDPEPQGEGLNGGEVDEVQGEVRVDDGKVTADDGQGDGNGCGHDLLGGAEVESPDADSWRCGDDVNDQPEDDSNNAVSASVPKTSGRSQNTPEMSADLPEDELAGRDPGDFVAEGEEGESVSVLLMSDELPPSDAVPEDVPELLASLSEASDGSPHRPASPPVTVQGDILPGAENGSCGEGTASLSGSDAEPRAESEANSQVVSHESSSAESPCVAGIAVKNLCQAPECDQSFPATCSKTVSELCQTQDEGVGPQVANGRVDGSSTDGSKELEGCDLKPDADVGSKPNGQEHSAIAEGSDDVQVTASSSSSEGGGLSVVSDSSSMASGGVPPAAPHGMCNSGQELREDASSDVKVDAQAPDFTVDEVTSLTEVDLASTLSSLSPSSSESSTPNPSSPMKAMQPPQLSPSTHPPPRPPLPVCNNPPVSSSSSSVQQNSNSPSQESLSHSSAQSSFEDDLLSELDAELTSSRSRSGQASARSPPVGLCLNGLKAADLSSIPGLAELQQQLAASGQQMQEKEEELQRLREEKREVGEELEAVSGERDHYLNQLQAARSKVSSDDLYLPQIKELEYTITKQQNEIRSLKDKLASHDTAAKRAIATLQNELKLRIDQVTKMYDECLREKDTMVVRFAEAEQKNIDAKRHSEKLEARLREVGRDKESVLTKLRAATTDRQKAISNLETKTSELNAILRETEKLKDAASSAEYRIKWFQNKLKAELESHKETKGTLEKTNIKLKEAREENTQIRRDCQAMIKVYQESEELKSNSLDKELRVKETLLQQQQQEKNDQTEVHQMTLKELEALKAQHKDNIEELKTLRDKVKCLEEERLQNEATLAKFKEIIQSQKLENHELQNRISVMSQLQEECTRTREMVTGLDRELEEVRVLNKDLQADMENCRRRESELLYLTEKLSNKNATLQSENTSLNNQVTTLSADNTNFKMEISKLEANAKDLEEKLAAEQKHRMEETTQLKSDLALRTKEGKEFLQQLEDERDASRVLKRKHASNVKDLARQLQHAKRRLEAVESQGGDRETISMGSRTSSNNSLHTIDSGAAHVSSSSRQPSQEQDGLPPEQVEVDKQVLIERIVKLQRAHARKNEKLDFLEDHIRQLVDQLQKKNRIIQNYALREEAGTLAPEFMDEHKALLAKKGGIMASMYSLHQQDGHMTLDLSLEISKKLQAVLEDTLLKNMTLKESLDTLGEEISRLSQENRQLQLRMQKLMKS